jgi:hypothetical protein
MHSSCGGRGIAARRRFTGPDITVSRVRPEVKTTLPRETAVSRLTALLRDTVPTKFWQGESLMAQ